MKQVNGVKSLGSPLRGSVVTIGNFDGLHCGHRHLIQRVRNEARSRGLESVVFTFHPHPSQVLRPEQGHFSLFPREDLVEQLAQEGVDWVVIEQFNASLAQLSPKEFIEGFIVPWLAPKHILVGHDFGFGASRSGSADELENLGCTHGFTVERLHAVAHNGQVVSSSAIRKALRDGAVEMASDLLGRPFYLKGEVIHGDGRGATIGVPTANLQLGEVVTPRTGVYATRAKIGRDNWPAVTNVGRVPTFHNSEKIRVESHILDQKIDLYGSPMVVEFISYLREERKFPSVADLKAQILADIIKVRAFFKTIP